MSCDRTEFGLLCPLVVLSCEWSENSSETKVLIQPCYFYCLPVVLSPCQYIVVELILKSTARGCSQSWQGRLEVSSPLYQGTKQRELLILSSPSPLGP